MKPSNRSEWFSGNIFLKIFLKMIFDKVPIPEAEMPEDEASLKYNFFNSPDGGFFC